MHIENASPTASETGDGVTDPDEPRTTGGVTDSGGPGTDDGVGTEQAGAHERDAEPHVVVGIPAYNEEVTIGTIVLQASQLADEVVLVDDGSTDETARIAAEAGGAVIEHETNRGKGQAVQTLLTYVRTNRCDVLVLLDGDGQHRPRDIPQLVDHIWNEGTDIVIGSRYLDAGPDDETPRYRRVGQRILDGLTNATSGVRVTDSQSGFRALSNDAIEELSLTTTGYEIESEMISRGAEQELTISEVPVDVRYEDVDGQTRNPVYHGLVVLQSILRMFGERHPTVFFGMVGVVSLLVGLSSGVVVFSGALSPLKVALSTSFVLFGVLSVHAAFVIGNVSRLIADQRIERERERYQQSD